MRDVAGTAVLCTVLEGKVTVRDWEPCTGMCVWLLPALLMARWWEGGERLARQGLLEENSIRIKFRRQEKVRAKQTWTMA